MAINMGGSGVGPSFAAAFGSRIISKAIIPGLFGMMVLIGALVAGQETANTLGKGIIKPEAFSSVLVSIVFLSVALSLLIANIAGIPQSTSQSTVFALIPPALYFSSFNPNKLFFEIIPTWFILPIASFLLSYLLGKFIYRPLRKRGLTIYGGWFGDNIFTKFLLLGMSMYVAFSIGSNNVANAVGPLSSMVLNVFDHTSEQASKIIIYLSVLVIAPCFGIGASFFGEKILKRTGTEIFVFSRFEAAIIAFVSASLLLFASLSRGIPTSLVQLNVGAILGVGIAKMGFKNIVTNWHVKEFFYMWLLSPIIALLLSLILTLIADYLNYI